MKRTLMHTTLLIAGLSLSAPALAAHRGPDGFYDYARVIKVRPITQTVRVERPQRECWSEPARHYRRTSHVPELFGATLGAAIGHQIGEGKGKDLATVAGALLGGTIAHRSKARHGPYHAGPSRNCTLRPVYYDQERTVGYRVKYRYRGQIGHTRTEHYPGKRIRIWVTATPAGRSVW